MGSIRDTRLAVKEVNGVRLATIVKIHNNVLASFVHILLALSVTAEIFNSVLLPIPKSPEIAYSVDTSNPVNREVGVAATRISSVHSYKSESLFID